MSEAAGEKVTITVKRFYWDEESRAMRTKPKGSNWHQIFVNATAYDALLTQRNALEAREKVLLECIRSAHKLLGALRGIDMHNASVRDSVGAAYVHLDAALATGAP